MRSLASEALHWLTAEWPADVLEQALPTPSPASNSPPADAVVELLLAA